MSFVLDLFVEVFGISFGEWIESKWSKLLVSFLFWTIILLIVFGIIILF